MYFLIFYLCLILFFSSIFIVPYCTTEHHLLDDHQIMFNYNNHHVARSFRREATNGGYLTLIRNNLKKYCEPICWANYRHNLHRVWAVLGTKNDLKKRLGEILGKLNNPNKYIAVRGRFTVNLLQECSLSKVNIIFPML